MKKGKNVTKKRKFEKDIQANKKENKKKRRK